MKSLFAFVMTAFAVSLAGFTIATNPLYVDGKLVIHGHKEKKCRFEIIVKGDDKIVANAKVDTSGHFELSFTPAQEKSFDFFYTDSHHEMDTIFLKSYKQFESDELKVTYYTFKGVVPVDKDDHVICPKCNQSGKVNAIEGLPGYYYCSGDRIKF
jgi:hypothetical protein